MACHPARRSRRLIRESRERGNGGGPPARKGRAHERDRYAGKEAGSYRRATAIGRPGGAVLGRHGGIGGLRGCGPPWPAGSGAVTLNDDLSAVSCPNARMCMAVGTSTGGLALSERWNGRRWAVRPVPQPAGAIGDGLDGVSCTSARRCTAVGDADISGSGSDTLVVRWNGNRWAIQPAPSEGTEGIPFAGVSCASATACTAVGIANEDPSTGAVSTLAEHWDAVAWTIQPTPPPVGGSVLSGVSCATPSACTAVGQDNLQADDGPLPLALHWNGTQWAGQPGPSDATTSLSGVSCTSRKACIAVGTDPAVGPMARRWNGTRWIRQTISGTKPLNGSRAPPGGGARRSAVSARVFPPACRWLSGGTATGGGRSASASQPGRAAMSWSRSRAHPGGGAPPSATTSPLPATP